MREVYNEELKTIKNEILLMSSQAERMLSDSITALEEQNVKLARSVISRDCQRGDCEAAARRRGFEKTFLHL